MTKNEITAEERAFNFCKFGCLNELADKLREATQKFERCEFNDVRDNYKEDILNAVEKLESAVITLDMLSVLLGISK